MTVAMFTSRTLGTPAALATAARMGPPTVGCMTAEALSVLPGAVVVMLAVKVSEAVATMVVC